MGVEEIPFIYRHHAEMAMKAVAEVIRVSGNPAVWETKNDTVYYLHKYAATDIGQSFVQLSFCEDADEGQFVSIIGHGKTKLLFGQQTLGTKKVFLPYPHSMYKTSDEDFLSEVGRAIKAMYKLLP